MAISPQLERYGRSIRRRLNLGFDILTDHGLQVAAQFDLVFEFPDYLKTVYSQFGNKLDQLHGESAYRLPMPARYIVDRQGRGVLFSAKFVLISDSFLSFPSRFISRIGSVRLPGQVQELIDDSVL